MIPDMGVGKTAVLSIVDGLAKEYIYKVGLIHSPRTSRDFSIIAQKCAKVRINKSVTHK